MAEAWGTREFARLRQGRMVTTLPASTAAGYGSPGTSDRRSSRGYHAAVPWLSCRNTSAMNRSTREPIRGDPRRPTSRPLASQVTTSEGRAVVTRP